MSKTIFLSYRRVDSPGYVARFGDDLEAHYGDAVFRDVDSILAGDDWQTVLKRQVAQAHVLVALIGPRWLRELQGRDDRTIDYVRYELNTAHDLNIPVIPVLLDNTQLPSTDKLGDLSWLSRIQSYSLSDVQNRWDHDSNVLVKRVGQLAGLVQVNRINGEPHSDSWLDGNRKWWVGAVAIPLLAAIIAGLFAMNSGVNVTAKNGVAAGGDVKGRDFKIETTPRTQP